MKIEYEATFPDIKKDDARKFLTQANATLIRPEFLQKRIVMELPKGHEVKGGFVRVRDEGDKITLTYKFVGGQKIEDQKEVLVVVDDFDTTVELLSSIGCTAQAYEESKRELWSCDGVEITIDDWPFLFSYIEVEGKSEGEVKRVSEKLGLKWENAKFCTAGTLYKEKYGFGPVDLAKKTGRMVSLAFNGPNPFVH
jgi:adenylate cyclase class 2